MRFLFTDIVLKEYVSMNKIACMIVTYNRCNLLKRCLDALDNQTYQEFDILVLNNGSSDETLAYLEERRKTTKKKLIIETVVQNRGMAYGYNRGYAAVFERGYEWIWTMDDDGLAENHQLEELLKSQKETGLLYLNALVCDIEKNGKLAFDVLGKKTILELKDKFIYGVVRPDNGTLINREIFNKCGNIKSELVSYGMETEYVSRALKYGFKVATVTSAIHYHPAKMSGSIRIAKYIPFTTINVNDLSNQNIYLYIRNYTYIFMNEKKYKDAFLYGFKPFIYCVLHGKLKLLPLLIRASYNGFRANIRFISFDLL